MVKPPIEIHTPIETIWRQQLTGRPGNVARLDLGDLLEAAGFEVPERVQVAVELTYGTDTVYLVATVRETGNVEG